MAKADHTISIRVEGLEELERLIASEAFARRANRWRILAAVGWAVAAALAATLLLGCSAPPGPEPDACPDVAHAEISLPEGCTDDPCGYETSLERCARTYVCDRNPGVCVTAYDCGCADELVACLDDGAQVPSICEGR